MSKLGDETRARDESAPAVVRSDGEGAARAYVEAEVPEEPRCPTMEMDRVRIVDPRRAPTMRREDMVKGGGPRAPEQMAVPAAKAPGVEAPMGRPATKMQVLKLDEEFLEELRQKKAEAGDGVEAPQRLTDPMPPKAPVQAEENGEARPASPWTKDAPEAVLVRASALPSSLRPREVEEVVAQGATPGRSRGAVVIVGAIVVAAIGIGARAMFGGTQSATEEPANGSNAATSAAPPARTAEERVAVPPSSTPTASAAAPVPVAPASVAPAPERPRPIGKRMLPGGEDPYADAAPPVKTAAPIVPPTAPPPTTATPKSTAPAAPTAPNNDGEIFQRPKPTSP